MATIKTHRSKKGTSVSDGQYNDAYRNKKTGVETTRSVKPNKANSSIGTRTTSVNKGTGTKTAVKKETVKISDHPAQHVLNGYNSSMKILGRPEKILKKTVTPVKKKMGGATKKKC
jgi:hypothetical protein